MNLAARANAALYIVVLLSITAFLTADETPLGLALALPVLAIGWLTSRAPRLTPRTLPRPMINLLVFVAIVNAAVRTSVFRTDANVVSPLGQFLILLELIKLFDRRTARDEAQLLALSVFVMIAAVLTSNTFLVGVQLLLFTPLCIGAAMLWQMSRGLRPAEHDDGARLPVIVAGARARSGFLRLYGTAVLACCLMAAVVFVLTPRGIGNDVFGRFGIVRERLIGFTEGVQLGNAGLLSEDPSPVMDVSITTGENEQIGTGQQTLYLRGGARDIYVPQSASWIDSSQADDDDGTKTEQVLPNHELLLDRHPSRRPTADHDPSKRIQHITMRAMPQSRNLFALWRPVSISSDRELKLTRSLNTSTIKQAEYIPGRFSYRVVSLLAEEPGPPPNAELGFQEGPIRELSETILRERGAGDTSTRTSRQVANAIRDHLRSRYAYTLEMTAPPEGMDAIEFFLFESKRGHCEYFASAMAAMCQSIGMPSRVVVGYVATEFNTLTQQYLVRQSNAHAWVEVFLVTDQDTGHGRWETFDPSPPGDIERIHRPPAGIVAQLRSWYDALEFNWSNSIVGFDNTKQNKLLGRNEQAAAAETRRANAFADRVASWLRPSRRGPQTSPAWVRYGLPALAVGALVYVAIRLRTPGRGPRRPKHARTGIRFYDDALRWLARGGESVAKPESSPPLSHADALDSVDEPLARAWREIAALFYRVRFAGKPLDAAEQARAAAAVAEVRARTNAIRKRARSSRR